MYDGAVHKSQASEPGDGQVSNESSPAMIIVRTDSRFTLICSMSSNTILRLAGERLLRKDGRVLLRSLDSLRREDNAHGLPGPQQIEVRA